MKKPAMAMVLCATLSAQTAFADAAPQAVMKAPVVAKDAAASPSDGIVLPILVLVLIAVAVANGGGNSAPPPMLVSDATLKTDIVRVGTAAHGLPLYQYRYVVGQERFEGVMAQDVLKVRPDAVHRLPTGHLAVDYAALGIPFRAVD